MNFIYDSFTWIVLGCFGIAGAEKFAKKIKNEKKLTYRTIPTISRY